MRLQRFDVELVEFDGEVCIGLLPESDGEVRLKRFNVELVELVGNGLSPESVTAVLGCS